MTRCPRCAHTNDETADSCAGCGALLAGPGGAESAASAGSAGGARNAGSAGSAGSAGNASSVGVAGGSEGLGGGASGSVGAAAPAYARFAAGADTDVVTEGESAAATRAERSGGPAPWERPPTVAAETAERPQWRPGQAGSDAIPAAPPRPAPRRGYPYALAGQVRVVFMVAAVVAAAYGLFAVTFRRGVFDRIAQDGTSVSADAAHVSDVVNGIGFGVVILLTVAAVAVLVWWVGRARPHVDRLPFGATCWVASALGLLGVLVGLGVHTASAAEQIGTGYIVLGGGWLLLALAAVRVVRAVGRTSRLADAHAGRTRRPH